MSSPTAAQSIQKIVVLGDSLTAGYRLPMEQAYPARLEAALRKSGYPNIHVINAGINGSTTASGPVRFEQLLQHKPDILILALGANDGLRGFPITQARQNLARIIESAQKHKVRVLLAGLQMPALARYYGPAYPIEIERMYSELAQTYRIPLVASMLNGVAGDPNLNLPDGVHPNANGQAVIATHLMTHLLPMLAQH